jgi:glycosyltransferase involved in cell wall biosynthesis
MPSPAPEPLAARPLSIWLVNPFDDIPGEGMPPLRYWTLARILAARGHDVTWWSATWSHRRKAIRSTPLGIREDEGFSVRLVAVRPYDRNVSWARFGSHRDFGRTFERLANESIAAGHMERPDIILASLPPLDSPEAAARLARTLDATFVLDVMDLWPDTFERLLPGPAVLRRLVAPWLLGGMHRRRRALVAAADAASAATNTYADVVLRDAPPETPRHICHLGAYLEEFPAPPRLMNHVPSADAPQATVAQESDSPLECVYAGSLESGQDVETLAAAARHLSAAGVRVTLHVAGTGRLEPLLRAADPGGSCRLQVHGLLARQAYVQLLRSCDVGLVLVKPESLVAVPYKACDYAAAGLALINSLPGELQRLIDEHGAGVSYIAGNAASLARAITVLAADRTALLAMRHGARRLAAATFDRERAYGRFADWLETLPSDRT